MPRGINAKSSERVTSRLSVETEADESTHQLVRIRPRVKDRQAFAELWKSLGEGSDYTAGLSFQQESTYSRKNRSQWQQGRVSADGVKHLKTTRLSKMSTDRHGFHAVVPTLCRTGNPSEYPSARLVSIYRSSSHNQVSFEIQTMANVALRTMENTIQLAVIRKEDGKAAKDSITLTDYKVVSGAMVGNRFVKTVQDPGSTPNSYAIYTMDGILPAVEEKRDRSSPESLGALDLLGSRSSNPALSTGQIDRRSGSAPLAEPFPLSEQSIHPALFEDSDDLGSFGEFDDHQSSEEYCGIAGSASGPHTYSTVLDQASASDIAGHEAFVQSQTMPESNTYASKIHATSWAVNDVGLNGYLPVNPDAIHPAGYQIAPPSVFGHSHTMHSDAPYGPAEWQPAAQHRMSPAHNIREGSKTTSAGPCSPPIMQHIDWGLPFDLDHAAATNLYSIDCLPTSLGDCEPHDLVSQAACPAPQQNSYQQHLLASGVSHGEATGAGTGLAATVSREPTFIAEEGRADTVDVEGQSCSAVDNFQHQSDMTPEEVEALLASVS